MSAPRISTILFVLFLGWSLEAQAAFCSLRDPNKAIQFFYPQSTSYQSIVQTINNETRIALKNILPIDMHFNEFGRHTLYLAYKDDFPMGMIHSRSEASDWGLIEFSWAISTNYRIDNFTYQRCRSTLCNEKIQQKIYASLKGKSLQELQDDTVLDSLTQKLSEYTDAEKAKDFAQTILNSALKTLALTELAWGFDVQKRSDNYHAALIRTALQNQSEVSVTHTQPNKESISALAQLDFLDTNSIQTHKVKQNQNNVSTASINWNINNKSGRLLFVFSDKGEILHFTQNYGELDDIMKQEFQSLVGTKAKSIDNCANATDLVSSALFLASSQLKTSE